MFTDYTRSYHADLYLPPNAKEMLVDFFGNLSKLRASPHAYKQMVEEPRGEIPMLTIGRLLNPDNRLVIMVEELNHTGEPLGKLQKIVVRCPGGDKCDSDDTFVVANNGTIISAWSNAKDDIPKYDPAIYWKEPE